MDQKMKFYKFNINRYMYIKLTDFGKQRIIEKQGYPYFKACIESAKQPNGYYKLQAHEVMNLLGQYLVMWARPNEMPFEPTIYFSDEDLEVR